MPSHTLPGPRVSCRCDKPGKATAGCSRHVSALALCAPAQCDRLASRRLSFRLLCVVRIVGALCGSASIPDPKLNRILEPWRFCVALLACAYRSSPIVPGQRNQANDKAAAPTLASLDLEHHRVRIRHRVVLTINDFVN